jgi:hypothetical protein
MSPGPRILPRSDHGKITYVPPNGTRKKYWFYRYRASRSRCRACIMSYTHKSNKGYFIIRVIDIEIEPEIL